MTPCYYAGKRLANAVGIFLADRRDPMSLTGLKLAFSEYRAAEEQERAAQAANDLQDGVQ